MTKSDLSSKRLSAAFLAGLLLLNSYAPVFAQASTDTKNPESDGRSASDTVNSVDSKVEKKVEQQIENPTPTAEPQLPSVDSILEGLKKEAEKNRADGQPKEDPNAYKNLGPTPVDPKSVLMNSSGEKPPAPTNPGGTSTATISPATQTAAPTTHQKEAPAPEPSSTVLKAGSNKLFGRIEQLAGDGEVKMPVLKSMNATLDPRGKLLPGEIEKYSGTIAKSFPTDFRGVWGGNLQIWSYRYSPAYLTIDRAEAVSSANVLRNGRSGAVNFNFYQDARTGGIALEPANVLLTVPMKDTNTFAQMSSGASGQMGQFSGMFNQMMGNMEAPVIGIHFGKAEANSMERGISGNDFKQDVVKNVIRDLGPGVLEQQIVTKYSSKTPEGKVHTGYDESVMRFKKLTNGQLYVLCAAVKYSSTGKYLSKLIMYGQVDKGRRMQTNPYANMNQMMGKMMNLGDMQKMMGGAAQKGGTIQVPQGGFGGMPGFGGFGGGQGGAGGAGGLNDILKQLNNLQNGSR